MCCSVRVAVQRAEGLLRQIDCQLQYQWRAAVCFVFLDASAAH